MKRVTVDALDEDGNSLAPSATALWPTMPVEYLHVGQSLYLKLERSAADRRPSVADLRWGDNRWRKQLRSVDLTYNRVL